LRISYISYDIEWNNNLFIHFSNLFNITQFLFEFMLDLEWLMLCEIRTYGSKKRNNGVLAVKNAKNTVL